MVNRNRNRKIDWSDSVLKSTAMKKVSGILVTLLLVSMLTPLLAFAGVWYGDIQYKDGRVTGSVYTDVNTVNDSVYLNVYDQDKNFLSVVTATYSEVKSVNGSVYRFYSFDQNIGVNSAVYLSSYYTELSATSVTYGTYSSAYTHSTTPIYGGGIIPVTSGNSIDATNGYISESQLKNALANSTSVEIKIKETIALPVGGLLGAKEGSVITVVGENGTYVLPLSLFDFEALAKKLGVDVKDLKINVEIKKVTGDAAAAVVKAAKNVGAAALSDAVDFNVTAEGKDGKKVAVDFGNTYVKRSINVNKAATKTATVALYNAEKKSLSFVPSTVSEKKADFQRTGNSIYVVVENSASFDDVTGHWAKADIELLASKLVVDGTGFGKFEADRNITRAEFAALAVKALGLTVNSVVYDTYFNDVDADAWYAGYVVAAKQAGLVDGYEDGSFQGDKNITREELSALVVRALKFAGVKTDITSSQQAAALAKFEDADSIVWAQKEVAAAIELGIVNGMTDTTLATDANATRAQSATMLKRLLTKASFI